MESSKFNETIEGPKSDRITYSEVSLWNGNFNFKSSFFYLRIIIII